MKQIRLYSLLGFLLGYSCVIAQDKMRCKETGFYQKSLKVCFSPCLKNILEEQCSEELKDFTGDIEFKFIISIPQERVLNTFIFIHNQNIPLNPKQRLSLKKALKSISLSFQGKKNNTRQAQMYYPYRTSWIYSIRNGHFEGV